MYANSLDELNQVNGFLESILTSLRAGVAVLDRELHVLVWNRHAEDLWGVRRDEAEHAHFLNLDVGLPVGRLMQPIRACLNGGDGQEVVVDATNRRGKAIQCKVSVSPLLTDKHEPIGAILLMEES